MLQKLRNFNDLQTISRIKFRSDINGLRAVAVIAVVFYHLDFTLFNGGWLGVDIFFVISGYLISNIIISELNNDLFNFKTFYLKRVKRILPPLLVTLIFSLPISYLLLTPKGLIEFNNSLISTLFFYSNIYFKKLDFYSAEPSKFMPLLHTWSLAIEEQFYIIFPIILFIIFRLNKKLVFPISVSVIFYSLFINTVSQGNDKFYLLHYRIWEFLLGVILMIFGSKYFQKNFQTLGLVFILFSIYYFDNSWINQTEPKIIALTGTSFIISSNNSKTLGYKFLSHPFLTFIGACSYSIYLIHQPMFSFFRIYKLNNFKYIKAGNTEINLIETFILLAVLIFLSNLSYKFIELKFIKNIFPVKNIMYLFVLIITFAMSYYMELIPTKKDNIPTKIYEYTQNVQNQEVFLNSKRCKNPNVETVCFFDNDSNRNVYVIGDSHLENLKTLVKQSEYFDFNIYYYSSGGCLFIFGTKFRNEDCPGESKESLDDYFLNIKDSTIIYGGRFPLHFTEQRFFNGYVKEAGDYGNSNGYSLDEKEELVKNTIKTFIDNNNTIILIYPIPEQGWHVPNLYINSVLDWSEDVSYPYSIWKKRVESTNSFLDTISDKKIYKVFPEKIFCDTFIKDACVGKYKNEIFYYDTNHLSNDGEVYISQEILKILQLVYEEDK